VKGKVPEKDIKCIVGKCEETIKWLDANQAAEKEEYEDKQKELEGEFNPIITRLYGAGGGQYPAPECRCGSGCNGSGVKGIVS
jgi:L1 cell adhesion molecule like protein